MDTLIHADIFFFVSTIALIFISLGIIVALIYIIKILRNVSDVSSKVKDESTEILSDIKERIDKGQFTFHWSYFKKICCTDC